MDEQDHTQVDLCFCRSPSARVVLERALEPLGIQLRCSPCRRRQCLERGLGPPRLVIDHGCEFSSVDDATAISGSSHHV